MLPSRESQASPALAHLAGFFILSLKSRVALSRSCNSNVLLHGWPGERKGRRLHTDSTESQTMYGSLIRWLQTWADQLAPHSSPQTSPKPPVHLQQGSLRAHADAICIPKRLSQRESFPQMLAVWSWILRNIIFSHENIYFSARCHGN